MRVSDGFDLTATDWWGCRLVHGGVRASLATNARAPRWARRVACEGGCGARSCGLALFRSLAQGLALQGDSVGAVDQAIEDGVSDRRIGEPAMPELHVKLAGDQGGACADAVV